jgi:hypothetical protein
VTPVTLIVPLFNANLQEAESVDTPRLAVKEAANRRSVRPFRHPVNPSLTMVLFHYCRSPSAIEIWATGLILRNIAGSSLIPPIGSERLEEVRLAMPTRVGRAFSEGPAELPPNTALT